jgi:hypothetical protein
VGETGIPQYSNQKGTRSKIGLFFLSEAKLRSDVSLCGVGDALFGADWETGMLKPFFDESQP